MFSYVLRFCGYSFTQENKLFSISWGNLSLEVIIGIRKRKNDRIPCMFDDNSMEKSRKVVHNCIEKEDS